MHSVAQPSAPSKLKTVTLWVPLVALNMRVCAHEPLLASHQCPPDQADHNNLPTALHRIIRPNWIATSGSADSVKPYHNRRPALRAVFT